MASWHVTGYYKCYHCMTDYFEFVNYFLNQGHRALLGDGPYLVQVLSSSPRNLTGSLPWPLSCPNLKPMN